MKYHCFFDGGCIGNGRYDADAYGSCAGYIVGDDMPHPNRVDPQYWINEAPDFADSRFDLNISAKRATNNMAEALSLHHLVVRLFSDNILCPDNEVFIYGDSQLIVNQVQGIWRVNNATLRKIYSDIHTVFSRYQKRYDQIVGRCLSLGLIPGTLMKQILGH